MSVVDEERVWVPLVAVVVVALLVPVVLDNVLLLVRVAELSDDVVL